MTEREMLELLLKGQMTMQESIGQLHTRLDNLDTKVDKIDASQVRMESELTEKVRALFDAREVSLDYFASIKNELVRLVEGQDQIKRNLYRLDSKQDEQERELRLIRLEKN